MLKTRELIQPLLITPGKELNNKFGHYKHSDLVGISYGSRVASRNGRGFIHVLRPTPELWTMALPHRTQILYLSDIAFITSWLDVRCGSRVIEAGKCPSGHGPPLFAFFIQSHIFFCFHDCRRTTWLRGPTVPPIV